MADELRVDLREEFKHVPSSGALELADISLAATSPRSPTRSQRSPHKDDKDKDNGNGNGNDKEDSDSGTKAETAQLAHPDHPHHSKFENAIMPERKYESTLKSVCSFIIFSEFCERMAFYGFQGSLVLFLTRVLHYSTGSADVQASIWNGFCYLTPLLGGWLADSKMGRFNAIMTFISIYMVGMVLVSLSAQSFISSAALFFPALYIVALGTGGIKPNVSTFGADQFDDRDPSDRKAKASYFNWFYFSINFGAFISHTAIAYLCQNVSFGLGFAVPSGAMAVAIVVFYIGKRRYKILPPQGSVFSRFLAILWEAGWTRRRTQGVVHWLDKATRAQGGSYEETDVADAKSVTRLFPFLGLLVIYWGVYAQMSTTFFNQGCQMDLALGSLTIPVSALNLFNTVGIIILIPVLDKLVYPALKRVGIVPTLLQKIGVGFIFATLSMVVAAFVEMKRLDVYHEGRLIGDTVCVEKNPPQAVDLSVFVQIPQYTLVGISEVLASVTALEFFYTQAPDSMKSVCAALNLVTTALGQWLMAVLVPLVNLNPNQKWIDHDANHSHFDWFFWLMSGLMFGNTLLFVWASRGYEYRAQEEPEDENEAEDGKLEPSVQRDIENEDELIG